MDKDKGYERRHTHYPHYDVMQEKAHWDDHTQAIVQQRLNAPHSLSVTREEVELLRAMAALLVDDNRSQILDFVIQHICAKLSSDSGEDQRQANTPQQDQLIKGGLQALQALSQTEHGESFVQLSLERQIALLVSLERDALPLQTPAGERVLASAFFQKMLTETVSAYYSHPLVWSEIGYGGPAYPRGYVRSEIGLTDPWEAQRDA